MNPEFLRTLEAAYGLSEILDAVPVEKGVLSANWILSTGVERHFLKRYRYEDSSRINEVHAAKQYFADAGIPIILPKNTLGGSTYISYEGRWFALFPFIAGRELERDNLSDTAIASMGSMLGHMHKAGASSTFSIAKNFGWNYEAFLSKARTLLEHIEGIEHKTQFDEMALQDLYQKVELTRANTKVFADLTIQSNHLLHGDYLNHNLFFTEQDSVSHVFDLEKSQYGPRVYEFVRSFLYSIADGAWSDEIARRIRIYIKAYRDVYDISDGEISRGLELYYIKSLHNAWIQHEHYLLGNTRPDQFLAADMARTAFLTEYRVKVLSDLLS